MIDCAELTALGPLTCITQRDYETECTNRNARPPGEPGIVSSAASVIFGQNFPINRRRIFSGPTLNADVFLVQGEANLNG